MLLEETISHLLGWLQQASQSNQYTFSCFPRIIICKCNVRAQLFCLQNNSIFNSSPHLGGQSQYGKTSENFNDTTDNSTHIAKRLRAGSSPLFIFSRPPILRNCTFWWQKWVPNVSEHIWEGSHSCQAGSSKHHPSRHGKKAEFFFQWSNSHNKLMAGLMQTSILAGSTHGFYELLENSVSWPHWHPPEWFH